MFIAFPIWWYVAPNIINIFPERCDLTGKTIIPFAISGGSGMGKTNNRLLPSCKGAKLENGKVFPANASMETLRAWANGIQKYTICLRRVICGDVFYSVFCMISASRNAPSS